MGEKQKMCLVRFLNNTVMVRVGGGWVTLAEFLENNDPCKGKEHFSSLLDFTVKHTITYKVVQEIVKYYSIINRNCK